MDYYKYKKYKSLYKRLGIQGGTNIATPSLTDWIKVDVDKPGERELVDNIKTFVDKDKKIKDITNNEIRHGLEQYINDCIIVANKICKECDITKFINNFTKDTLKLLKLLNYDDNVHINPNFQKLVKKLVSNFNLILEMISNLMGTQSETSSSRETRVCNRRGKLGGSNGHRTTRSKSPVRREPHLVIPNPETNSFRRIENVIRRILGLLPVGVLVTDRIAINRNILQAQVDLIKIILLGLMLLVVNNHNPGDNLILNMSNIVLFGVIFINQLNASIISEQVDQYEETGHLREFDRWQRRDE